jgi:hypothetical protein
MKKLLLYISSLLFALSCLVQLNAIPIPGANRGGEAVPRVTKSGGIERSYVQRAKLTEAEEKIVIALARKQGVEKVARISTYNIHPSSARGIRVQGVEKVREREVSYQVLTVNYRKWFHPGMEPRKGDVRMGDFWAGKPYTRKQTILRVGKTDYRCSSLQGLSFKEAESMLGLFLAGKFTYNPGARINERLLAQVDWNKPSRFSKRGDAISVGFPHKGGTGSGFFDMEVQFEGGKLTIKEMFQAIP